MMKNMNDISEDLDFTSANILVVGDVMLDTYWQGDTSRISPEAPVPVVSIEAIENRLGGAANVAANIKALGAKVKLVGVVGEDGAARDLKNLLDSNGILADLVHADVKTCTKLRVIGRSQQLIRCDFEQSYAAYANQVLAHFKENLGWATAVVFSDYAKGALELVQDMIKLANLNKVPVLVDPKGKDFSRYSGATVVTPNFKEFELVVGKVDSEDTLEQQAMKLLGDHSIQALLVTRGAKGMSLFEANSKPYHVPALAREVFDITGAGDTVIATMSCCLGSGMSAQVAADIANRAAGIVVGKLGTAMVSLDELNFDLAHRNPHQKSHQKIVELEKMQQIRGSLKLKNQKIVMTNGCFDILHAGHVSYLAKARSFGDRLIIAVNTDDSVRKLKGPSRPINALEHRLQVLAALDCVDWVIPFKEETPIHLIEALKPDVLAKGADYKVAEIAGADVVIAHGGEVKLVDLVAGCSTTKTVKQIQNERESVGV